METTVAAQELQFDNAQSFLILADPYISELICNGKRFRHSIIMCNGVNDSSYCDTKLNLNCFSIWHHFKLDYLSIRSLTIERCNKLSRYVRRDSVVSFDVPAHEFILCRKNESWYFTLSSTQNDAASALGLFTATK